MDADGTVARCLIGVKTVKFPNKGVRFLVALTALFAAVVAACAIWFSGADSAKVLPSQALDHMMDKLRVTQRAEIAAWAAEDMPPDIGNEETPVWADRHGHTMHARPVCGGMTSPVRMTVGEGLAQGFVFCADCW